MAYITLRAVVRSVEVTGGGYDGVDVEITDLDTDDVLSEITIKDAIDAYGESDLLEAIGQEAAMEYFGIKSEV